MNAVVVVGFRAALEEAAPGAGAALGVRLGLAGLLPAMGWEDPRPSDEQLWARVQYEAHREFARAACSALTTARIPHCVYKGVGLGALYAPAVRTAADVDVLLDGSRTTDALEALAQCQAVVAADAWDAAPPSMRRSVELEWRGGVPVAVDLAWALVNVNRLISDARHTDLEEIWTSVHADDGVSIPSAGVHLALVVHHLVHHDLLHAPGLVDAALLWASLDEQAMDAAAVLAKRLGVARVTSGLVGEFARRFGLLGPPWPGRVAAPRLDVSRLLGNAGTGTGPAITARRAWRRARLLDRRRDVWRLARDVVAPPPAYLAWRWPESRGYGSRWLRHAAQTTRKLILGP
jgi:hypothetical protein